MNNYYSNDENYGSDANVMMIMLVILIRWNKRNEKFYKLSIVYNITV